MAKLGVESTGSEQREGDMSVSALNNKLEHRRSGGQ